MSSGSHGWTSQSTFDIVSRNLADLGGLSLDEYLYGDTNSSFTPAPHVHQRAILPPPLSLPEISPPPPAKATETVNVNAVTRLHQTCQRVFGNTDALEFEFIEQNGPRNKQCILTITRPDRTKRSYATQPTFAKKNEAKAEAAKTAIEMGALEFLMNGGGEAAKPKRGLVLSSVARADTAGAGPVASTSKTTNDAVSSINEIERCCAEWRAGSVAPHWVGFFEPKLGHKQGCALRIQLSPNVVRVHLSDSTFDTYPEAKLACAKAAVSEGVLDFIKHGNGQTRPLLPIPFSPPASSGQATLIVNARTPLTLQSFYDSLPRPFPESFETNDAVEINAPGWLNGMVQSARGGKLAITFLFTSDGTPGLHGCVLKLDRPGEYRAYLVDARFPKRSDAKAAVSLQAMSHGVGNYIRSITSAVQEKVTPLMRSFSTNFIYPTLTAELSKIHLELHPRLEFKKERDAFGASLVVELSATPTPEQVRRYTIPTDYRNKADAKAAAVCYAAEQGAIEFVRLRGKEPPLGYVSPYTLRNYDPEASQKRKRAEGTEEAGQGSPQKKQKKAKKREAESSSTQGESSQATSVGQSQPIRSGGHVPEPSGIGFDAGSGAAHFTPHTYGPPLPPTQAAIHSMSFIPPYGPQPYIAPCPPPFDPRFAGGDVGTPAGYHSYGMHQPPLVFAPNPPHPPHVPYHGPPPAWGPSGQPRVGPGHSSHFVPRSSAVSTRLEHSDVEPGEVLSSRGSEFSESSSQNNRKAKKQGLKIKMKGNNSPTTPQGTQPIKEKTKDKGTSTTNTPSSTPPEGQDGEPSSHVKKLTDHCGQNGLGTPAFHEEKSENKFKVWIIIGKERFDLPTTYRTAEEGRQRVAKQVLARLRQQKT
ncbi:hypothetical protein PAXRUDRAFT_832706 [Paxillus rubicundulus Ve08.2h10]|uniref:Uncharacterized protein n=1 Tax=Paxillus rubicundulus Ve08.2h10 TaxID=930991 RepID=A0A0D0DBY9_9AGAM|nr:hypothetical protein PAXRUDRAFT_832706 [Paxillus rubicundulus Ve08.2h10]